MVLYDIDGLLLTEKESKKYIKGYDVFTTKWNVIGEKNFIQLMLLDKYYEYKLGILDNCDIFDIRYILDYLENCADVVRARTRDVIIDYSNSKKKTFEATKEDFEQLNEDFHLGLTTLAFRKSKSKKLKSKKKSKKSKSKKKTK